MCFKIKCEWSSASVVLSLCIFLVFVFEKKILFSFLTVEQFLKVRGTGKLRFHIYLFIFLLFCFAVQYSSLSYPYFYGSNYSLLVVHVINFHHSTVSFGFEPSLFFYTRLNIVVSNCQHCLTYYLTFSSFYHFS